MRHIIAGLIVAASLVACAPTPVVLVPEQRTDTAELNDRLAADDDESNQRAFMVMAIDGTPVRNVVNGRQELPFSRSAVPYMLARYVPAKAISVTLRGQHVSFAPVQLLARKAAGKYREVEGTIPFTPKAGRVYRANGELSDRESSIWIEDFETKEVVSAKVVVRPNDN